MGYFNLELKKADIELEEALYFVSEYTKRYAVDQEDREYATEVIDRIYNEENTADDILYITTCREMINRWIIINRTI